MTDMSERVLIVDDNESVREVFRSHLAEVGFAVDVACSLPEAAKRLAAIPYSAVIADVSLSEEAGTGKEGLAIAAYIRALWEEMPVVILTGNPTSAAAAARLGVDAFLRRYGLDDDQLRIVIVSRLERQLKLEGLERLMAASETLAEDLPVRLIVVGGGSMLPLLEMKAEEVNGRLGRQAIILTGPLTDPRPAYAAAHVVAGMGGSILRGMAFAKPAVVLGERGFSAAVTPDTVKQFLVEGFYGVGDGDIGVEQLYQQLRGLLEDRERRKRLGVFGRQLVCAQFDVGVAAATLERIYGRALDGRTPARPQLAEAARTLAWIGGFKAKQRLLQWRARRAPQAGA